MSSKNEEREVISAHHKLPSVAFSSADGIIWKSSGLDPAKARNLEFRSRDMGVFSSHEKYKGLRVEVNVPPLGLLVNKELLGVILD